MPTFAGRNFLIVALILIGILVLPSGSGALSLEELLSLIQGQYEKNRDYQADFIQETFIKSMGKTDREQGRLFFKKPRKMLWLYEKPHTKTLIVNTEKSWLYLPEDNVVYLRRTDQLIRSTAAVRLLSGLGSIQHDFRIQFLKSEQVDEHGNYVLLLTPKATNAGFIKAHIDIEGNSYNIVQIWFEDDLGNSTRVILTNIKLNQNLSDRTFLFVPPAGVEVFTLP
jgi:outer membrane lipoprotein carrier protein